MTVYVAIKDRNLLDFLVCFPISGRVLCPAEVSACYQAAEKEVDESLAILAMRYGDWCDMTGETPVAPHVWLQEKMYERFLDSSPTDPSEEG